MWRSFFLAVGLSSIFFGVECLGVDKMNLRLREPPPAPAPATFWREAPPPPKQGPQRVVTPPHWLPWSLMSTGAVVCLYSFTIPSRWKKSEG